MTRKLRDIKREIEAEWNIIDRIKKERGRGHELEIHIRRLKRLLIERDDYLKNKKYK